MSRGSELDRDEGLDCGSNARTSAALFSPGTNFGATDAQSPFVVESSRFRARSPSWSCGTNDRSRPNIFNRPSATTLHRAHAHVKCSFACCFACTSWVAANPQWGPAIAVREVHLWSVPSQNIATGGA